MLIEKIIVGPMQVNCYILGTNNNQAIIIDPGSDHIKIKRRLDKLALTPKFIINTHGHYDHIGCDDKFSVPIYIHRLDKELLLDPHKNLSGFFGMPFRLNSSIHTLEDNEMIELDEIKLLVLHTPGHTPGGICLYLKEVCLFTGDTLFYQGIGRTDFPGASEDELLKSIRNKILAFDDKILIYPGHGPESSVGRERRDNPFF